MIMTKQLIEYMIAVAISTAAMPGYAGENEVNVTGESLVLAGTRPGNLCFDRIQPGSVVVRSTFEPGGTVYVEERDYVVDYSSGTVSRTGDSRIPDYSRHILYGKKDFNHREYCYSDCCNTEWFVWIDYRTANGFRLALPNDQSKLLSKTREKLEAGGTFLMIGYGDSITPGCDVPDKNLIFTSLFIQYLKQKYPQVEIRYQDLSIPGYSSSSGLEWYDRKPEGFESPAIGSLKQADLVLIGFGMNDHNIGGSTPEKFENNLVELAELSRKRLGAEVILFSCFPPNEDWHFGSHRMDRFAAATRTAAARAGCAYVDVYDTWKMVLKRKDQSSLLANNINHPNYFGHWLYEQAFEAMTF